MLQMLQGSLAAFLPLDELLFKGTIERSSQLSVNVKNVHEEMHNFISQFVLDLFC